MNIGWIRIRNFCLDPDSELGNFKAGSGSGINHSGSATLLFRTLGITNHTQFVFVLDFLVLQVLLKRKIKRTDDLPRKDSLEEMLT